MSDTQQAGKTYSKPEIADHGTLVDLTAACALGTGGDAFGAGAVGGVTFGKSNPAFGCKSN